MWLILIFAKFLNTVYNFLFGTKTDVSLPIYTEISYLSMLHYSYAYFINYFYFFSSSAHHEHFLPYKYCEENLAHINLHQRNLVQNNIYARINDWLLYSQVFNVFMVYRFFYTNINYFLYPIFE